MKHERPSDELGRFCFKVKYHNDLPQVPTTQSRNLMLTGCEERKPFFTLRKTKD
jgi:hypothetical protein